MRKQLLLLLFSIFAVMGFARTVTGVVTSATDKQAVIGASVRVHGTTRGVTTDIDGKFTIDASDNDVLDITFVGMKPISVKVGSQSSLNIVMTDNAQTLGEVVVTAMGQTQEKKKLNFAVQALNADEVTAGGTSNFANSLQGKVAGLQVSTGGGSPNSSTQVIIRAISSINNGQNNEPLVIVDGMAIRGHGTSLGDINPDDIENMSVLKGAAASALYGQEASNGVIMITTKSGARDGSVKVNGNASVEFSTPMRVPQIQRVFTPGVKGMYKENSGSGGKVIQYVKVQPDDCKEILEKSVIGDEIIERLLYKKGDKAYVQPDEIPFIAKQTRIVLENCGKFDAESLDEYLAAGGFAALKKAMFEMTRDQVIDEVDKSGLRGRGGGGFPTGKKWKQVARQKETVRYVVCNGDEGDPGAFMDGSVMEGDPFKLIEGMMIAGYAVRAENGYIYVRAEYPMSVARLKNAIAQLEERGLLGDNILGSDFSFHMHINKGAGAFVCGEGSALTASIEGNRGMPRTKPPRTVEKGLWEKPTVLNNVETYAACPTRSLRLWY